jgi:hypothetical protein
MVEYKGGSCRLCGYSEVLRALTFHHVDPATKRFNFAGSHHRSWASLQRELDKTVLLCARCHIEVEDGSRSLPAEVVEEAERSDRTRQADELDPG